MSIFTELKCRNVFKVGIAWLVAQVLQLVFETFGTPDWAMKNALVLLAMGLPLALFFACGVMGSDGVRVKCQSECTLALYSNPGYLSALWHFTLTPVIFFTLTPVILTPVISATAIVELLLLRVWAAFHRWPPTGQGWPFARSSDY